MIHTAVVSSQVKSTAGAANCEHITSLHGECISADLESRSAVSSAPAERERVIAATYFELP